MTRSIGLAIAAASLLSLPAHADKASASTSKLILKVGPDPTEIYLDGKKRGTSDKLHEVQLAPGTHIIRLVHKGDEREDQVVIKKNVATTFEWKFEDDRPKPATDDESGSDDKGDEGKAAEPKAAEPK